MIDVNVESRQKLSSLGNSALARWYYNADDRECVPFQYNGKRGNQNNFETQAECMRTCPGMKYSHPRFFVHILMDSGEILPEKSDGSKVEYLQSNCASYPSTGEPAEADRRDTPSIGRRSVSIVWKKNIT